MMGTFECVYETPCHWCTKWDKKCDRKIPERGQRVKIDPVDDGIDISLVVGVNCCISENDHEWETYSLSTTGDNQRCRKCGAMRTLIPMGVR